jgi:bacteriocin-like protein
MNNQSQIEVLSDDQLDQVSGGTKKCDAAAALAGALAANAIIFGSLGDDKTANSMLDRAMGVIQGGCM